jgi:hypothetical protein
MKSRCRPQAELAVQMIACRTLAETHSPTTTVAMMISRMSDTWVTLGLSAESAGSRRFLELAFRIS